MDNSALALSLAGLGFLLTAIWGWPFMHLLKHFNMAEAVRVVSPSTDATREGPASMGGLLIIISVLLITLALNIVSIVGLPILGNSIFVPMASMVLFGVLGGLTDLRHLRGRQGGFPARAKLIVQLLIALSLAYVLWTLLDVPQLYIPFWEKEIPLGVWFLPIAVLVIFGSINAVNLTGGIDGLSGMLTVIGFGSFGVIALIQEQIFVARFCFTVVGALFGFLWFNIKPAALTMGYTGRFALGGTLGVISLMTGQWPLLVFIIIIPVIEAISVILQIGYFKISKGKRLFRMAPIHFHFELSGWSHTQIVQRFWLMNLLFATIGITLAVV